MRKTLTCIALLASAALVSAQDTTVPEEQITQDAGPSVATLQSADTLHLSLEQALEIALNDNPTIVVANMEIQRVDYAQKQAWYGLLPTISATASYSRTIKSQMMIMGGMEIPVQRDNLAGVGATISLPLVVPALWHSIQMAEVDMKLTNEKARASKIDMTNSVKKAYYGHLVAKESYAALQESYRLASDIYEDTQRKYKAGVATEFDLITADVNMRNMLPMITQVDNGVRQSLLMIKVLLGLQADLPMVIDGKLHNYDSAVKPIAMTEINSSMLDANPSLRQIGIQQEQLATQFKLQRTARYPTLVAFGSFDYQGQGYDKDTPSFGFGGTQIVPGGMVWPSPAVMAGVKLNVPIFSGFTNVMKEKQIRVTQKEIEVQREYLNNNLQVQLRTALDEVNRTLTLFESSQEALRLAEKVYQISTKRFETGAGIMIEVNNANQQLTQARLAHAQAIVDYLNAKADMEKLLGQGF